VSEDAYPDGDDLLNRVNPDKVKWKQRSEGFFFSPQAEDVGRFFRLTVSPRDGDGVEGESYSVHSKFLISPGPGACPFESRQAFTDRAVDGGKGLRVVTYNILADLYADSEYSRTILHPQCPPYALDIDYRRQLIVKELLGYHASLICLQEVDVKVFQGDLEPTLSFSGLEGRMAKKGGQVSEGCATFWRQSDFECVSSETFVLSDRLFECAHLSHLVDAVKANPALETQVKERTTVMQATVLKSKCVPNMFFVVGNTHLFFKPDADHIRLLQAAVILAELNRLVEELREKEMSPRVHLILCGDFNSTPPFAVLEFLQKGRIAEDHADWRSSPGLEVEGLAVEHAFKMASACGSPKYTNYTQGFKDCLDYIFYTSDSLQVSQVVPFPSEEELSAHVAIPSVVFPSDHVARVADLEYVR